MTFVGALRYSQRQLALILEKHDRHIPRSDGVHNMSTGLAGEDQSSASSPALLSQWLGSFLERLNFSGRALVYDSQHAALL